MKHHFLDLLDRTGDYWTVVPNMKRYAYTAGDNIRNKKAVKILTISKHDKHWKQVFDCPNVEELTLHEPSAEQIQEIKKLPRVTRLRITHLRTPDIGFIGALTNVKELILEYVSGFSDLSPLQKLTELRSLHLENLRRVTSFDGLRGIGSLRYLYISGTLDWNQPIEDFTFLEGLANLEVFSLGFIINKTPFPALLPILALQHLKKIRFGRATFRTNEYAFLEAALPGVEGCSWDLCRDSGVCYEFLDKRAGYVNKSNPAAGKRCGELLHVYTQMKQESETIINSYRAGKIR
ncbi:MAG: hypothetical protein ABW019_13930 [Chitinophagaceae bacterium]